MSVLSRPTNGYAQRMAKKLRDYFTAHTRPVQLLDMGPDVFDATVDTNILLFQNVASDVPSAFRAATLGTDFDKQTDNIAGYLNDNGVVMEMPTKDEPWAILSSAELALKRKIADIGKPLKGVGSKYLSRHYNRF